MATDHTHPKGWVRGSRAGTRYPDYRDAQRAARDRSGARWDYFVEPFLNQHTPADDLDFITHTAGR